MEPSKITSPSIVSPDKQLKPWTATFEVSPARTEKSARKKAEAFAATFEKECREGVTSDSRQKFSAYCDYAIAMKERIGAKHSTIVRYKELTVRIYPVIGHMKAHSVGKSLVRNGPVDKVGI